MLYIVIDVGCLECGETSGIYSTHSDMAKAVKSMNKAPTFTLGQHAYFIVSTDGATATTV
jgi:hypothetical protein